ncbi:4'-phosphopantetheinyl transferase family protein [Streptomyces sp. NPDC090025]|uniref:4'-phosphopantetheinyl transferase family protein n=1 Tax=Streptomyces sp. NPDC090025 TaxID=3365922 RepID=UPI003834BDED
MRATGATGAEAWLLELDEAAAGPVRAAGAMAVLDERERARAAAFVRAEDRVLYTAAHVALRRVLGELLDVRPAELVFRREPCPCCGEPHGRPALDVPGLTEPPLHFSLSHTRGRVLIATAPVPVGADVEARPDPAAVPDLTTVLHPAERAELAAERDPFRQALAFGRIWARKEAYLKGLGTGLGRAPHLDDVRPSAAAPPPGWTLYDVDCGPAHHGAMAVASAAGPPPTVHRL